MKLIQIFNKKKILLLNIFLTLYVGINFIGGERGLISFLEKTKTEKSLIYKKGKLEKNLSVLENKNLLLSEKLDLDYLDILYREKLKFGKKEEIIIKLR